MKKDLLNRPFWTQGCPSAIPALKRWDILFSSIRDEGTQILAALVWMSELPQPKESQRYPSRPKSQIANLKFHV